MIKDYGKLGVRSAMNLLKNKGYMRKVYGDRFLEEVDLGTNESKSYCIYFPQVATMGEIVSKIGPYHEGVSCISKIINESPWETGTRDIEALDRIKANVNRYQSQKLVLGLFQLTSYTGCLKLSKGLTQALGIKNKSSVYLSLVPSNAVLIISSTPLVNQSIKTTFVVKDGEAILHSSVAKAVLDTFDIKFPPGHRFLCNDISIERKGCPVAIINMKSNIGTWIGRNLSTDMYSVTDIDIEYENTKDDKATLKSLLDDSDNEEDA